MDITRWQQIEDLYHDALDRPLIERSQFLSDACSGDPELFREVESLLSSLDPDDSFMATPEFDVGLRILAKPDPVLQSGQDFGHYKICDFLGRGGMGEVYLAEDTKLGRHVALKVLPADVASDQERIHRFIQEARAASALNHPNILTIHEIGEADGWRFIASEFVEGQTLRERIKDGEPFELHEAIDLALQITAALNAAHKVHIVHRDIKPENIMLREDGLVKVLDFGLAKLIESPDSQTLTANFASTSPGMVMGTIAYMSPEQTRGKNTEARSDIWSLGVVLHEMLIGRLPFGGDTSSDMIAAILTTEPALPENETWMPDSLRRIIIKALRKNPDERYQAVNEMAEELRGVFSDADTAPSGSFREPTDLKFISRTDPAFVPTGEAIRHSKPEEIRAGWSGYKIGVAFVSILTLVLVGGFAGSAILKNTLWATREPMKITRVFDTGKTTTAAISPDGKYVAHALTDGGQESLWIKHIATNSNVQLVMPEKSSFSTITFSKDGNYIYYVKGEPTSPLYQVPVLGGDSKKILDNVNSHISFSPDGTEFAFIRWLSDDESVLMVAGTTGTAERPLITRRHPEVFGNYGVSWSPNGKIIAGSVYTGSNRMNIALIPVDGGETRLLSTQKWLEIEQVAWLPDGSGLLGAALDDVGENLTQIWFFPISGENARLITNDLNQYQGISLTDNADRLLTIGWQKRQNIWRLPKGKSEEAQILSNNIYAEYRYISISTDGRIVFPSNENANGTRDIWIMNVDGTGAKQLTSNAGGNILPCVTSDGRYVLFASNRPDRKTYHIWRMNIDGTNPVQLTNGINGEKGPRCPPDPKTVFYVSSGPNVAVDKGRLWKTSIDGGEAVQLTDYATGGPDISPDGKFIAMRFRFDDSTPLKLGIVPVTGGKPVKVFDVNLNQSLFLRWRPDGQAITFVKTENGVSNFWEQPVNGDPAKPVTKFTAELVLGFDWSRDGDLICARGYEARDPVLISNFK